jgi:DNA repair exonuclease SbcCD nuclease subunit
MRIGLIADPHLNKTIYKGVMDEEHPDLPFRNADMMRALEFAIDKNINEIYPDLVVILGDVYNTPHPLNPPRTFFNSQLRKLAAANIPTIILVGNHDICSKHHALEPIAALGLKTVKVIVSPTLTSFKDKILMLFPYSIEVEQGKVAIREQFHKFVASSKATIAKNTSFQGKDIMFFGHFGVNGAVKNTYDEDESEAFSDFDIGPTKRDLINRKESDISLSDLDSIGAKYVFLGDYHQHQILPTKNSIAMYVGSPEKGNFAEKDHKKGFVVYDSDCPNGSMGACTFIEYPFCRPMIELKGIYDSMIKDIESYPPSTKTLIKMCFIGDENQLLEYSLKLDDLKKKLQAKFKPIYILPLQKVINEEEAREASEIENEIMSNGHISDDDVKDVAEEGIKEKEKDPSEQMILIQMSNEVYEETRITAAE